MASDNISGTDASGPKLVFLAPGMVIQWLMYMSVGGQKTYGDVRQQTRLARSGLMTWVYSAFFWVVVLGMGFTSLAERYRTGGSSETGHSRQALETRCVEMVVEKATMTRPEAERYCADYYHNN